MRNAFSSTSQARAFALLLVTVLVSPAVMVKSLLPSREQAYLNQGWGSGPYPWIHNQIYQETNAIDIAFIGSSHIINAIDTPYVQQQLSERLGHQTVVRSIGWGGSGYDGLYLVAGDLLQHRKVNLLIFYDEKVELGDRVRNGVLTSLFRFGEDYQVLLGLPFRDQASYYAVSLIGMPKTVLNLTRPNLPAEVFSNQPGFIEPENRGFLGAPENLGAIDDLRGFTPDYFNPNHAPFTPYRPQTPSVATAYVYSEAVKSLFEFSTAPLPRWHEQFARSFAALAQSNACHLAMINIPVYEERRLAKISERAFWPDELDADVKIIGIVPAAMFNGLTDEEAQKLYKDPVHFNQNGQQYFTQLITPAILHLYETYTNH